MSVPVWLVVLSDQLPIVGLVSHYLTNYLMGRRLIYQRDPLARTWSYAVLALLSECYPPLEGRLSTYYSPVRHFTGAEALSRATCMC